MRGTIEDPMVLAALGVLGGMCVAHAVPPAPPYMSRGRGRQLVCVNLTVALQLLYIYGVNAGMWIAYK